MNQQTKILASYAASVGGRDRLAEGFHARTMRDPLQRADRELADAVSSAEAGLAAIAKAAERAKLADVALLEQLQAEFLERHRRAWAAYQHAGARTLNWMVTGPARFPVASNRKKMDTEHRRLEELLAIAKGAGEWARKRIERAIAQQLGPVGLADRELEEARANLAARKHRQELMKATNAAQRKHKGDAAAIERALEAASFPEAKVMVSALGKSGLLHSKPFEAFQLTNNGAEIRRLEERVRILEQRAAAVAAAAEAPAAEELEQVDEDAPRIVENALEQRLQIFFPDRPSAELRDRLKARGFRWAPSQGAWQRQLTTNARDAARAILAA